MSRPHSLPELTFRTSADAKFGDGSCCSVRVLEKIIRGMDETEGGLEDIAEGESGDSSGLKSTHTEVGGRLQSKILAERVRSRRRACGR